MWVFINIHCMYICIYRYMWDICAYQRDNLIHSKFGTTSFLFCFLVCLVTVTVRSQSMKINLKIKCCAIIPKYVVLWYIHIQVLKFLATISGRSIGFDYLNSTKVQKKTVLNKDKVAGSCSKFTEPMPYMTEWNAHSNKCSQYNCNLY